LYVKRESSGIAPVASKQRSLHISRSTSDGISRSAGTCSPLLKDKTKVEGFPRTSPNRPTERRFFSDSQTPTMRRALAWVSKSINMKGLATASHSLDVQFEQLTLLCKRIGTLMDLRNAHSAYTMLYQCLSICCREHDTYIIDFELETGNRSSSSSTAGRFRFAVPWNGTSPGEEVWLAIKARPGYSSFDCRSHRNQLKCPLRSAVNSDSFTNAEAVLQLSHYEGQSIQAATTAGTPVGESLGPLKLYLNPSIVNEAEIVCLAKQLAIAVLKFNYTPWVSAFWTTDDVILFSETQQSSFSLRRPHFRVQLASAHQQGTEVYGSRTRSVMFCLGVVLYELWKNFPLDDISNRYDPDLERFRKVNIVDFREEYVREISTKILSRAEDWLYDGRVDREYFDIMAWCLSAPQSNTEELENPQLLNELYEAVVCGLESVENEYKKSPSVTIKDLFSNY
jgi:hypothetical protein